MCCHFFLKGIFPTQGSNPPLLQLLALAGGFFTTEPPAECLEPKLGSKVEATRISEESYPLQLDYKKPEEKTASKVTLNSGTRSLPNSKNSRCFPSKSSRSDDGGPKLHSPCVTRSQACTYQPPCSHVPARLRPGRVLGRKSTRVKALGSPARIQSPQNQPEGNPAAPLGERQR